MNAINVVELRPQGEWAAMTVRTLLAVARELAPQRLTVVRPLDTRKAIILEVRTNKMRPSNAYLNGLVTRTSHPVRTSALAGHAEILASYSRTESALCRKPFRSHLKARSVGCRPHKAGRSVALSWRPHDMVPGANHLRALYCLDKDSIGVSGLVQSARAHDSDPIAVLATFGVPSRRSLTIRC